MNMAWTAILYNEERGIRKTIQSIRNVIDGAIIGIDIKTNDSTLDIIQEELKGTPLWIYDFNIEDGYSKARNIGIEIAERNNFEYVIVVDGDEYLDKSSEDVLKRLKKVDNKEILNRTGMSLNSIVSIMIGTDIEQQYQMSAPTIRIFKSKYRYRYRVHESPNVPDGSSAFMPDIIFHNDKHKDDRIEKSHKGRIDLLLKDIEEFETPEQMFNIAMEYMAEKEFGEAAKWFEKCIPNIPGSMEYMAKLKLARCNKKLNEFEEMYDMLYSLVVSHPYRNEHLIELGAFFLERQNYFNALMFLSAAANVNKPKTSEMIMDHYYNDLPWKLLLIVFEGIKYEEGIKNVKEILEKTK